MQVAAWTPNTHSVTHKMATGGAHLKQALILKMSNDSCYTFLSQEQPKAAAEEEEEEEAEKEESGTLRRPAKRARTSFTVDQLQVRRNLSVSFA